LLVKRTHRGRVAAEWLFTQAGVKHEDSLDSCLKRFL
jgi:hypothetical protein